MEEQEVDLSSLVTDSSTTANLTLDQYVSQLRSEMIPETVVYVAFWLIGTAGNLFILHQLLFNKSSKTSQSRRHGAKINFLISQLAIADLFVIWFTITTEIAWRISVAWNTSELGCRVVQVMRAYGLYLTSMIVICISLDRFYAFVYPMSVFNSDHRNNRLVLFSYLIAFAASLPNGVVFHIMEHPEVPGFFQCVTMDSFSAKWAELAYNAASVAGFYLIPVSVIVVCYSAILKNIDSAAGMTSTTVTTTSSRGHRNSTGIINRETRENGSPGHGVDEKDSIPLANHLTVSGQTRRGTRTPHSLSPNSNPCPVDQGSTADQKEVFSLDSQNRKALMARAKRKTLRMSISIVVTFVICWTPYALMLMWEVWDAESLRRGIPEWLRGILYILACANSCVNPFIHSRHLFVQALRPVTRGQRNGDTATHTQNTDQRHIRSFTDTRETQV